MELPSPVHGPVPRRAGQRLGASRRPAERGAHPALRRGPLRPPARHLPGRSGAGRVRRHGSAGLVGGDPARAGRPAGLGRLHRHAEGPERLLRALRAGGCLAGVVRPEAEGVGDRADRGRGTGGAEGGTVGRRICAGDGDQLRGGHRRRVLCVGPDGGGGGGADRSRGPRSGLRGARGLRSRHRRLNGDLAGAVRGPRDPADRLHREFRRGAGLVRPGPA